MCIWWGGRTRGLHIVSADTGRGRLVLASAAVHYFGNAALDHPFPLVHHAEAMLEGFRLVKRLAPRPDHIVAGHDPAVLRLFPPVGPKVMPCIVRLDGDPVRP